MIRTITMTAAVVQVGLVFCQEPVKLFTVCEVLAKAKALSDKPVAVVGRLDCDSANLIDFPCYLVEDRCDQPVVSAGGTWPNKIWIRRISPAASKSSIEIDPAVLREKLSVLRKSTKLGTHQVMRLKKENEKLNPAGWGDQPDEWGLGLGRIVVTKWLQRYSGALVALEMNASDLRKVKADEDVELERKK